MRIARLFVIGGLLMGATAAAEAGWLGFGSNLPKPISMLTVSRPWDPSHTHPSLRSHKYDKTGWGARWKQVLRDSERHSHPYIRGY